MMAFAWSPTLWPILRSTLCSNPRRFISERSCSLKSGAEAPAAEAAYLAGIECAHSQSAKYYELRAITSFARWLKERARTAEAQALLAENYTWFTEGFDTSALKEAKALFDELSDGPALPRRRNKLTKKP